MQTHDFAIEALPPDASSSALELECRQLAFLTEQMAMQTLRTPPFEVKLVIARHLAALVEVLSQLLQRVAYFGNESELVTLRRSTQEWVFEQYWASWQTENEKLSSQAALLAAAAEAHASKLHPVWDAGTRQALHTTTVLLQSFSEELVRIMQTPEIQGLDHARSFSFASANPEIAQRYSPARDARFYPVAKVAGMPDLDINAIVLMGTEIPTIEHCCSLYIDFPNMPTAFHLDMARQMADEVRHADGFVERINWLARDIKRFPVDFDLWSSVTERPLAMRLAIHQRVGEWAGVAAQEAYVDRLNTEGADPVFAKFLKYVTLDEIQHVAYGNKWLRYLSPNEDQVWEIDAQARRIRGTPPLPYPAWAAEMAGFCSADTQRLRALTTGTALDT